MNNDNEQEIFRKAMQDVRPLNKKHARIVAKQPQSRPNTIKKPALESSPEPPTIILKGSPLPCTAEETLFFSKPGLQTKTIRKLKRGQLSIEAKLDLHSMIIEQAQEALTNFLQFCKENEKRLVLIIHGKGTATIKSCVNGWLRNYMDSLAFCSAQPKDGGTGAIYLLLKR